MIKRVFWFRPMTRSLRLPRRWGRARLHWLPAVLLTLTLGAYLGTTPAYRSVSLADDAAWGAGVYVQERDPTGRPFRWTAPQATLYPATLARGVELLALRLQHGRSTVDPLALHLSGADLHLVVPVQQTWRTYHLLLDTAKGRPPLRLELNAPAYRVPNETRRLGVTLGGLETQRIAAGLPWRALSVPLLLLQAGLVWHLVRSLWRSPWLPTYAGALWSALVLLWLWSAGDDYVALLRNSYLTIALLASSAVVPALAHASTLAELRISAWERRDVLLVGALVLIALGLRLLLLPNTVWQLNGDDYLTGVYALNILQGRPNLYYGHHTGTLASYLLAPMLALGGASLFSLLALPLLLTSVLIVTLYGLGRDLGGRWSGFGAALWIALPSATAMLWTNKAQPGYLEAITCAALALWGTVRLLWGTPSRRAQIALMAAISLMATLALWANYVVASILATCAGVAALHWRRLRHLPRTGYLLLVLIPLAVWLLPLLIYVVHHPGHNPLWWTFGVQRPRVDTLTALHALITRLFPLLIGVTRPPGRVPLTGLPAALMITSVLMVLLVLLVLAIGQRRRAAWLPLGLTLLAALAFALSSFNGLWSDVRYILPLYIALALGYGLLLALLRHRYSRAWALALTGVLMLTPNAISTLGDANWRLRTVARPEAALAATLSAHGVRYVYTSYWIGMGLMYESAGAILTSSAVGPSRTVYDPWPEQQVRAAAGRDTAFVFRHNGAATPAWEQYRRAQGVTCQVTAVAGFLIYEHCTPFPAIGALQRVLPEAHE